MSYAVSILPAAKKAMAALPKVDRGRVDRRIMALSEDPRPPGCVKLAGPANLWRVRVGDWRIVYAVDDAVRAVHVAVVAHRREVYRGL